MKIISSFVFWHFFCFSSLTSRFALARCSAAGWLWFAYILYVVCRFYSSLFPCSFFLLLVRSSVQHELSQNFFFLEFLECSADNFAIVKRSFLLFFAYLYLWLDLFGWFSVSRVSVWSGFESKSMIRFSFLIQLEILSTSAENFI